MTDKKTLDLAREWAEHHAHAELVLDAAAAEVITALPDTIVDGDKLREVINAQLDSHPHGTVGHHVAEDLACKLQDLLPDPVLPTLADMSTEECQAYRWRMVDTPEGEGVYFAQHANSAAVLYSSGRHIFWKLEEVTPLLDRPGMVWPGRVARPDGCCGACPETVGGGVDCTCAGNPRCPNHRPRPEDVPVGESWQVEVDGEAAIGFRNDPEDRWPWCVTYQVNSRSDWLGDSDVTLVARLVPETTEQDDEAVLDPAYIYRDKDGLKWEYLDGRWITGDTHAKRVAGRKDRPGRDTLPSWFGPYTRIENTK